MRRDWQPGGSARNHSRELRSAGISAQTNGGLGRSLFTIRATCQRLIMLCVGLVGIGFMGWIHYLSYRKTKGVKLAAVCTRDERRLGGDWRGIRGNFGPPGEQVDLSGVAKYSDLDDLLADKSIDLVDI